MVAEKVAKKVLKKPPEKVRIGRKNYFLRNVFYEVLYWTANSPVPEIFFVAAFVFSADQSKTGFNYTTQVWQPLLLLVVMSSLAYFIYRLVFGKGSTSHLAAIIFAYFFYGYYATGSTTVHTLLPKLNGSAAHLNPAVTLLMMVVFVAVAGLLAAAARLAVAKMSILKNLQAFKILLAAVGLVFLVELLRFVNRYFTIH